MVELKWSKRSNTSISSQGSPFVTFACSCVYTINLVVKGRRRFVPVGNVDYERLSEDKMRDSSESIRVQDAGNILYAR